MVELNDSQVADLKRVLEHIVPTDPYTLSSPKSLILTGPDGAGKRTLVRAVSSELDCELIEIDCSDEPGVRAGIADVAFGLKLAISPLMILLYDLESLDSESIRDIGRLILDRVVIDEAGKRQFLPTSTYIIGCLAAGEFYSFTITPEHRIVSKFDARVEIAVPSSLEDLRIVCQAMISEIRTGVVLEDEALESVRKLLGPPDWLKTLQRCIHEALILVGDGSSLSSEHISEASHKEAERDVMLISIRGHPIPLDRYQRWAGQFPDEIGYLAIRIVKCIAHRFCVSRWRYHEAIREIIENAHVGARAVSFCRWQDMGSSADRVASEIKTQAGWKKETEIDLHRPADSWPILDGKKAPYIAIVDDFVGSGGTLLRLLESREFSELLARYPDSEILVLIISGFTSGINRIYGALRRYDKRVRLIVSRLCLFDDRDQCFHPESRAITDDRDQRSLREYCLYSARERMRMKSLTMALGYKGLGALVVFPESVPNNTLPIIWYTGGEWCPLVPRSGLP